MLESAAKIIPVFCQVKPSDLHYIEAGVYAEAFIKYEEKGRYLEKLNAWKEALRSLSLIAGEEFNNRYYFCNFGNRRFYSSFELCLSFFSRNPFIIYNVSVNGIAKK